MAIRVLFLCARGSSRAYFAATLLEASAPGRFEVWATPFHNKDEQRLVQSLLQEKSRTAIAADRLIQPTFQMHWDEGIVLCSGLSDT